MKLTREEIADALNTLAILLGAGHVIWTGERMPLNPEGTGPDVEAGRVTLNHIWKNRSIITVILSRPDRLSPGERRILWRWQRQAVSGWFTLLEIDGDDAIVAGPGKEKTFWRVCPLVSTWEEMTAGLPLPVRYQGALLPWKDSIIGDGFLRIETELPNPPEELQEQQELYRALRQAKEKGTIRTGFPSLEKPVSMRKKKRPAGGKRRK